MATYIFYIKFEYRIRFLIHQYPILNNSFQNLIVLILRIFEEEGVKCEGVKISVIPTMPIAHT